MCRCCFTLCQYLDPVTILLALTDGCFQVPRGLPYFAVDFGLQGGFAHVIENEQKFPHYFGKVSFPRVMNVSQGGLCVLNVLHTFHFVSQINKVRFLFPNLFISALAGNSRRHDGPGATSLEEVD